MAGLVWVLANAGGLPGPWPGVALGGGVVLFLVAVGFGVVRRWNRTSARPPTPSALRVYLVSVVAMLVLIPAGSVVLRGPLDRPELGLPWVVAVVGAHFLPFARAFRAPVFAGLGFGLLAVGIAGAVLVAPLGATGTALTGVAAGVVLLVVSALGGRTAPAS